MSSRAISDLRAPFRLRAENWQRACEAAGLEVLVYCTLRTLEEQTRLYEQGRTTPGPIVTYAKAGESAHNYGLALDFVPMAGSKPLWAPGSTAYRKAIALAADEGMESASTWTRFKEWPHLQEPGWRQYI